MESNAGALPPNDNEKLSFAEAVAAAGCPMGKVEQEVAEGFVEVMYRKGLEPNDAARVALELSRVLADYGRRIVPQALLDHPFLGLP